MRLYITLTMIPIGGPDLQQLRLPPLRALPGDVAEAPRLLDGVYYCYGYYDYYYYHYCYYQY